MLGVLCQFTEWGVAEKTVQAGARYSNQPAVDELRRDLAKIDEFSADGGYEDAAVIVGQDIRARTIYRHYIKKASGISEDLFTIRKRLSLQGDSITLQQLGAMSQRLSQENLQFRDSFRHGEEQFHTYHLIQTAITNLEDAIEYWRIGNRYRRVYRGALRDRIEDDEILKVKLQAAVNAIEELNTIRETREALAKELDEE